MGRHHWVVLRWFPRSSRLTAPTPLSSRMLVYPLAPWSLRQLRNKSYLKNLLRRNKKKLLSQKNLLRSGRGVKQQRKPFWKSNNCMRTWRSNRKRTISSFKESCRRALLVSLLGPDPAITSRACGFWTILVVRWTICCVMMNYISVVCSGVMNYMWL